MALNEPYISSLFTLLISSLSTLLGVFAGAWARRNADRDKWLRAERAKVFADFLRLIDEAFSNSVDAIHTPTTDGLQKDIEVTKAYSIPLNHARIVRLYLPIAKREEFEKLARNIWSLHATKGLGDNRIIQVKEKLMDIQRIFEGCL